ncbi:unnamed protein product [Phytomonas sp. Hart1]|nr:unnamed protein product [Phytomonas sp. Hart1]|eukprot:CCW67682.1 unnamed protein product [Phytomonas sp. isolate Hart1]
MLVNNICTSTKLPPLVLSLLHKAQTSSKIAFSIGIYPRTLTHSFRLASTTRAAAGEDSSKPATRRGRLPKKPNVVSPALHGDSSLTNTSVMPENPQAPFLITPPVPKPLETTLKNKKKRSQGNSTQGKRTKTTKGSKVNANVDFDINLDELSIFSEMLSDEHTPRNFSQTTLVYNALTGRMTSEMSNSIACLKDIGFGINEQRQIYVEKPEEINKLAERVRLGTSSLPSKWPTMLTRVLGGIFKNPVITDPAEAIQQMIQIKVNSVMRSKYTSIVTSSSCEGNEADDKSIRDFLLESDDDAKGIELNSEQERVIAITLKGHNMYIGGSAGTGKSVLLRALNRRLRANHLRVAMTATTGVAGCHIGGSTFHHIMGVSSKGEFLRRSNILDYDVIIIDEVSMLPQSLFEDFDRVMREEAGTPDLPFGGVQIILCGDFLQLGCINEKSVIYSKIFADNFVKLCLQTQVRQSAFPIFAQNLQQMRLGIVPSNLTEMVKELPPGTMVDSAVNLLPTNSEVQVANERELTRLPGDPLTLTPETGITSLKCEATVTLLLRTNKENFNVHLFSKYVRSLLQATLDFPRASLLSIYRIYEDGHAMRVVLPQSESVAWREAMRERFIEVAGLINDLNLGATVTEIVPNGDGLHTPENEECLHKLMAKHPIAQPLTFKKGCRVLLRSNISTNLVNGSIGTVVDLVECKLANFPEYLRNVNIEECIERYRMFCVTECGMPIPLVPVVKFHSGETVPVPPWEFNVGGTPATNYYSLSLVALPLTLAYAFTVHKVQGLTLVGRVHLELARMWPCEHLLYVAMSRVRNPDQLSISNFRENMVVANKDCVTFDHDLKAAEDITVEELRGYPVSSWRRCNDTILHLRRRGSSLRRLLQDTMCANGREGGMERPLPALSGLDLSSASDGDTREEEGERKDPLRAGSGRAPRTSSAHTDHLVSVERSVIVARRMRKLIRCVERATKLSESRRKTKATVVLGAPVSSPPTAANGEGMVPLTFQESNGNGVRTDLTPTKNAEDDLSATEFSF